MYRGGGGVPIDSPEHLIGAIVPAVVAAPVWSWTVAD
jgi:hypothetical protein